MPVAIQRDVALAPFTTLELGGPAEYFAHVQDRAELSEALAWAEARALPVTILGGGSNVLIADRGIAGLTLRIEARGVRFEPAGERVLATVAAGEVWDAFVAEAVARDLAGIECLSGIPGSVGATPIQNVGAYGQEVQHCIEAVEVVDRQSGAVRWLANAECAFRYRDSRFKREPGRYIVLQVRFALQPSAAPSLRYAELQQAFAAQGGTPSLGQVREHVLALRRAKSMLIEAHDQNRRSVGSFFLNPIVSASEADAIEARAAADGGMPRYPQPDGRQKLAAGWLIEHAGIRKGEQHGAVGVSSRHALALVHHGGGTSAELIALARDVRARVAARFGVTLEPEPVLLGFATAELG
jgi:UDP-N-acetylmuramate dehydrogenase